MEVEPAEFLGLETEEKKENQVDIKVTLEPGQFDVEAYLANYTGPTRIQRLLFIAKKCPQLSVTCWKMAVSEYKQSWNSGGYRTLVQRHGSEFGEELDGAWIDSKERQAAAEFESLELRLNTAKTNAQREDTRV